MGVGKKKGTCVACSKVAMADHVIVDLGKDKVIEEDVRNNEPSKNEIQVLYLSNQFGNDANNNCCEKEVAVTSRIEPSEAECGGICYMTKQIDHGVLETVNDEMEHAEPFILANVNKECCVRGSCVHGLWINWCRGRKSRTSEEAIPYERWNRGGNKNIREWEKMWRSS